MIPANFNYHRADSIEEAISLLQDNQGDAKLLAGGHSLLPAMKLRLNQPGTLIDIGKIAELNFIRIEGNELVIGAGVTHSAIARNELVKNKLPFFSEAADLIGDVQVRNMGTIGGSIAHADPAADWPALLLAAEAKVKVRGTNGNRSIEATDFFTGFFATALQENEIIVEIRVALPPDHTTTAYRKFMQPASRFALAGCAVKLTQVNGQCRRARVAFTGVSDAAFRDVKVEEALEGHPLDVDSIKAAASLAADGMSIMSDHFASEEYRGHLARVFAKRALLAAANY